MDTFTNMIHDLLPEVPTGVPVTYEFFWRSLETRKPLVRQVSTRLREEPRKPFDPDTIEGMRELYHTFQAFYLYFTAQGTETLSLEDSFEARYQILRPYIELFPQRYSPLTTYLNEDHRTQLQQRLQQLREHLARTKILIVTKEETHEEVSRTAEAVASRKRLKFAQRPFDESAIADESALVLCKPNGHSVRELRGIIYHVLNYPHPFVNIVLDPGLWKEIEEQLQKKAAKLRPGRPQQQPVLDSLETERIANFTSAEDVESVIVMSYQAAEATRQCLEAGNREVQEATHRALRKAATWQADDLYRKVDYLVQPFANENHPYLGQDCFRAVLAHLSRIRERGICVHPRSGPFGLRLEDVTVLVPNHVWNIGKSEGESP